MAALTAGAILGGSIIGAGSQKNTNQAQMDFAQEMSSTQYQRAVEDMRAAGINPVMAATNGGASSPTANPTSPGASIQNGLMSAARTLAVELPQARANIEQQGANTAVARAAEKRTNEETKLTQANTRVQQANAKVRENDVSRSNVEAVPWKIGDAYVEGAKKNMKADATWNKPPVAPQNNTKAYEAGKGTSYGGSSSAKQYEREVQRYNDKQNSGIMKR